MTNLEYLNLKDDEYSSNNIGDNSLKNLEYLNIKNN